MNTFETYWKYHSDKSTAFCNLLSAYRRLRECPYVKTLRERFHELEKLADAAKRRHYQSDWNEAKGWDAKLQVIAQFRDFELTWADGYADPGYPECEKGLILANWNDETRYDSTTGKRELVDDTPSRLEKLFERMGYELDWPDTTYVCECGKAVVTQADSMFSNPYFAVGDGWLTCGDCVKKDPADYLELLIGGDA